ncbi:translational GTPase TypA [bacterium]|nr:translational GTPase TypA [bacterium]
MNIRNIAIIAHVDHGKTTLVNQLLISSHTFRSNEKIIDRALDSNDLERERGITILAKTTSLDFDGYRINILDTPGHADFGGEVERIMNMVDGVLLVVDAYEGVMPQTRFVLKKALEMKVKPIVVVNKVDRENADIDRVLDETLNLFIELGADDSLLDYKVLYASALKGTSSYSPSIDSQRLGMEPILKTIIKEIPEPRVTVDGPFLMQPALLDYNDYVGRIGIGLVKRGSIKVGDTISLSRINGTVKQYRIQKIFGYFGLNRIEIETAKAGDICAIAGIPDIFVGETICSPDEVVALPLLRIDPPTLEMTFGVNTSPFSGKDGKLLTCTKIEERLKKEVEKDVSLKVEKIPSSESFMVSGRGELHLSILIENMRREGFEIQVSKPQVIIKEIDGVKMEPFEDVQIDVPEIYLGSIIDLMSNRAAELVKMTYHENQVRIEYVIPSRGLLGFMNTFLTQTHGYGIINHTYKEYRPMISLNIGERKIGVLIATETGSATTYALEHTEERGTMFISPGALVYEGMIVGENRYSNDLEVTVVKEREKTNQRSTSKDQTVVLKAPRRMTLEQCLDYINQDELLEITPNTYRMRKKILNTPERKKYEAKINRSKE